MKIILIEDEKSLNTALSLFLKSEGYEVFSFENLSEFLENYKKILPDLIISDIHLPDGNFLEELKKHPELDYVKKIVISANTQINNIKTAFNLGAEDFIKKPFDYEEVSLRIKKIFNALKSKETLAPNLEYDFNKKVIIKDNKEIELTKKEATLLELLLKNRGKVLTNTILIDYIWDEPVSTNTLNVLIKRLRAKLGKNIIKTKRDLGYIIE